MSGYVYTILGSGRQGTSAAYDLVRFGDAEEIILVDKNPDTARRSQQRINQLTDTDIARAEAFDLRNEHRLSSLLEKTDVALSAVPYYYNPAIARFCIKAGSHMCDMGGHTHTVKQQLKLDAKAKHAGVSVVPDCGMGPGLNITMAAFIKEKFENPRSILVYDGGLPREPQPPWNYQLTFHINGLTNEMDGQAIFVRDGQITPVDTLTEPEQVIFSPVGPLEADVTSGGLSTSPWDFASELDRYENKTLRFHGHFAWLRAYKALGLFSEEPVRIGDQEVVPRDVFHHLLEPKITPADIRDICLIRVIGKGEVDHEQKTFQVDLVDTYDKRTGFTAMERLTGWHAAIMMGFQARGTVSPGCHPIHAAVDPVLFMRELEKRGIPHQITVQE